MVDSKKVLSVTAGFVGAAGLAALATGANTVSASTGTVSYKSGATTVWNSPSWHQVKRYVTFGDTVQLLGKTVDQNGATWYKVGDNQWIPELYLNVAGKTATVETPSSAASQTAVSQAPASQAPTSKAPATQTPAAPQTDTQTANTQLYVKNIGSAVTVWTTPAYTHATGQYLEGSQTLTAVAQQQANGETWYRLANGGYVPARFVSTTPVAVTPQPAAPQSNEASVASTNTNAVNDSAAASSAAASQAAASSAAASTAAANAAVESANATASQAAASEAAASHAAASQAAASQAAASQAAASQAAASQAAASQAAASQAAASQAAASQAAASQAAANAAQQAPANQANVTTTQVNANQGQRQTATATPAVNTSNQTAAVSASRQAKIQAVIAIAEQQVGKPYVWGGKGPNSFDCSGLMYYAFLNGAGVNIGGWTVPQESSGTQVSLSALQPGDLLFWGSHGSTYHVALYIGGGTMIQAPQPGENVKYTALAYFMPDFAVRPSL
ncbi:cell wall hydrolase P75 [Lacticaseibacillus rhamnosus]|uniref:cell wall hydrolase P75 n=1 Tax=Lacticaseibacillus rhamnosus TaxID=47715 RepID=UPI0007E1B858|nr:cell wall hydrolase P75 [Lacticaseibacillus rhamnosus]MDH5103661.1 cell wall hydrolase P75 [Lacticaseibacillus rhamnosus]OAU75070.1 glycoside hydrolase [Lacticaseibacillus rhamnosus]RXS51431.1 glycoside hydrolase [Lacticaseibacillus rhamnosus]TLQ23473.1 glycoside hydrolase [Lacticaseibacillus rhamnosus]WND14677.1 cell wall hydrolase P75 [Lacticaseibacillus rhamnosus]